MSFVIKKYIKKHPRNEHCEQGRLGVRGVGFGAISQGRSRLVPLTGL